MLGRSTLFEVFSHPSIPFEGFWSNYSDQTAEVTTNSGLVREFPQNPINSGLVAQTKDVKKTCFQSGTLMKMDERMFFGVDSTFLSL